MTTIEARLTPPPNADVPEWAWPGVPNDCDPDATGTSGTSGPAPARPGKRYPLSQLLDYAVAMHGNAPALGDGQLTLNFSTVERAARVFCTALHASGVRAGRAVVILAEKSVWTPVLAIAIWKLGAIYIPVDPSWPAARLASCLQHLVDPLLVFPDAAALMHLFPQAACPWPGMLLAPLAEKVLAGEDTGFEAPVLPDADESAVAYIIFTSGSSGIPKGVQIARRSLLDYFSRHNDMLRFSAASRVFSIAPFYFDVSIEDTLLPLSLGAFVRQFRGLPAGAVIKPILQRERITHLIAVSTILGLLTQSGDTLSRATLPDMQMLMTGAEVCDPAVINHWKRALPDIRIYNVYGPTEATIVCAGYEIKQADASRNKAYPIGQALRDIPLRLADGAGRLLPGEPGDEGELWIGGSQVMCGYVGLPGETARVLVDTPEGRFYRSGDICRIDQERQFEFVGRTDDEVKIGGRRIHLGELRQLALGLPGVDQVAVGLDNGKEILMVAVGREPGTLGPRLRQHLEAHLPAWMMPRHLQVIDQIFLGGSGKTDEKTLLRHARPLDKANSSHES